NKRKGLIPLLHQCADEENKADTTKLESSSSSQVCDPCQLRFLVRNATSFGLEYATVLSGGHEELAFTTQSGTTSPLRTLSLSSAMSTDTEQATPLAVGTKRPDNDEELPAASATRRRSRFQGRCLICGGFCAAILIIIAIVIVVLALTVFKVKEPVMTMNSVTVENLAINFGTPSSSSQLFAVNMTVVADISVKNPNAASVRFGASTTAIYYRAREMGVAYGPPGSARAHRTFRINVTVDVMADRILGDANLFDDLAAGSIAVTTATKVGGRVKVLGMFKHHVDVMMNCSITMAVANQSIVGQNCNQKVRL
ncbi:hypothetical protein B296_00012663, partial [Ensete ventricosum]